MLDKNQLEKLRKEIVLGSVYVNDYENSLNICPKNVCDFFDGYLEELMYRMQEGWNGIGDDDFWKYVDEYDTIDCLEEYYDMFEEDPLPYDKTYAYMRENRIEWGNGSKYDGLKEHEDELEV